MQLRDVARRLPCMVLTLSLHAPALIALYVASSTPESLERPTLESDQRPLTLATLLFVGGNGEAPLAFAVAMHERALRSIFMPVPQVELQVVAADSFELSESISDAQELEQAQRLQGVYVGQIKSRVQRVLAESGAFRLPAALPCVIHVIQDEQGRVLEVQDDECAAQTNVREHIADAVRRASPLPLPPQGLAMGSYLTLDLKDWQ